MDRTGEHERRSICEELGARLDVSSAVKMLSVAWVVPGVSLLWVGFANSGIRSAGEATVRQSLEHVQAMSVMLAIFSTVVGAIWAFRTWDDLPSLRKGGASRADAVRSRFVVLLHLGAGALATLSMVVANIGDSATLLVPLAACSGFCAGLVVLRAIAMAPVFRPQTLAAFATAILFQVTIGWLHLLDPTGPFAVMLIAQGLLLVWTAIAAAREFGAVQQAVREQRMVRLQAPATPSVSQEPALLPLPEPAVGH